MVVASTVNVLQMAVVALDLQTVITIQLVSFVCLYSIPISNW